MKEPRGGWLVRLLHRACPWESNALPPHVADAPTFRLQVHLKDKSILLSDSNVAILLETSRVLEETSQANASRGISGVQSELERGHTCDTTGEQYSHRDRSD